MIRMELQFFDGGIGNNYLEGKFIFEGANQAPYKIKYISN